MKTVYKPWGKEVWLELNDHYCYKRIYINKGTRTSYQYHLEKLETNFIIEGTAEVWLENEKGTVEKKLMHAGDYFTVKPPRKHRVIALTDLILQEVSTPQVDDVVRIEDDTNRDNGKIEIEHLRPAMCILTAGKGSRLGSLSEHVNKALIPINNKAAISHLIEKTPPDYDIVVAVGYKHNQVIDYCRHMHPNRKFTFVKVSDYDPSSTGPATSLFACRKHLQRPFFFAASDILIENKSIGNCDKNWMSVYQTALSEIYATVEIKDNKILKIRDKSEKGYSHAWTGMLSIYDYELFWKEFKPTDREIPDVLSRTLEKINYYPKEYEWYDLGTFDSYMSAKKYFENQSHENFIIPKSGFEFFYKNKDRVCKYFPEGNSKVNKLTKRSKCLSNESDITPNIKEYSDNTGILCYDWLEGEDLYQIDSFEVYSKCLSEMANLLWDKKHEHDDFNDVKKVAKSFYKENSLNRFESFINQDPGRKKYLQPILINGDKLDNFYNNLSVVLNDDSDIFNPIPVYNYHGDFHPANLIYNEKNQKFKLIDWRSEFTSDVAWGDVYYDLGKLYAGCKVQFSKIKSMNNEMYNKLVKHQKTDEFYLDEHRSENLIKFNNYYDEWIKANNYNLKKVKCIAGLVLCRIASLHTHNQGNFLFLQGRRLINEAIQV